MQSFGTSAQIYARTSAGYIAQKLYVQAAFPFLKIVFDIAFDEIAGAKL